MRHYSQTFIYRLLDRLNCLACRIMYRVTTQSPCPLPETGAVLLVSDHSSYSDPMVLAATAGRPVIFLTAREVYELSILNWLCRVLHYIPVTRGAEDIGAVRAMLRAIRQGAVIGIFPEGGIEDHREEGGHLGIGYLALKTGVTVVPVSIAWDKERPVNLLRSLFTRGQAVVRYGPPIVFQPDRDLERDRIRAVTAKIMEAIEKVRTGKD